MSFLQQKFREIVFHWLFSMDISASCEEETVALIMQELAVSKKIVKEAQQRAFLVWQKKNEIDSLIGQTSQAFDFERIQRAERNALRLGVYELFFDEELPPKVAIAEAIRLCRKFSTPEASHFVNALLDTLYQKRENPLT